MAPPIATGSNGLMPNSTLDSNVDVATATSMPASAPAATGRIVCASTKRSIWGARAPSAKIGFLFKFLAIVTA